MFFLIALACSPLDPLAQAVVDQVIGPEMSEEEVRLYKVGAVVGSTSLLVFGPEDFEGPAALEEPATLFLVDWVPEAKWSHPSTWVWVSDDAEILQEEVHEWFPVVDDEVFLPNQNQPVFGVQEQVDGEIMPWEEERSSRRRQAQPGWSDECPGEKAKVAVTATTWESSFTVGDVIAFNNYIDDIAGYTTYSVANFDADLAKREEAILRQFDFVDAVYKPGEIEELVIYYSGHGATGSGTLVMGGKSTGSASITAAELAAKVKAIDPLSVTLILDSCYSDSFAQAFASQMLTSEGGRRAQLRVLSSSGATEVSFGGDGMSKYTRALNDDYLTSWGDPAWETVEVQPVQGRTSIRVNIAGENRTPVIREYDVLVWQTPTNRVSDFTLSRVTLQETPSKDQVCTAVDLEEQDYSRQLRIGGVAFGEDQGRVYLQDSAGAWKEMNIVYWSDENIVFNVPLRAGGFPANGSSKDMSPQTEGIYLAQVETPAGLSDPAPILIRPQVYTQEYTPTTEKIWAELWHPMTENGTVQLSDLSLSSELDPTWAYGEGQGNAIHQTSQGMQNTPYWAYELNAAERDLETAKDTSFPDYNYYGFRVIFGEDFESTGSWKYTLVYD